MHSAEYGVMLYTAIVKNELVGTNKKVLACTEAYTSIGVLLKETLVAQLLQVPNHTCRKCLIKK